MFSKLRIPVLSLILSLSILGCRSQKLPDAKAEYDKSTTVETAIGSLTLPSPYAEKSKVKVSKVVGWEEGQTPIAPEGFTVKLFAKDLDNPRWSYVGPNNDIFVAEASTRNSANRIALFRDSDGDGIYEKRIVFAEGLNSNFGMLILNGYFYVANTDGLYRWPYTEGADKLEGEGEKILDLPAGGYNNHWTRNLIANEAGTKIYVSVGSASNVGEHGMEVENRRAAILEINPDGTGEKIFASGIRNPVGMGWNPVTGELWTAVNERDELGDNLVPDYLTSVKEGGFYGWPYSYFGQLEDPRLKGQAPELVAKSIVPDVSVGPHTASLGLTFYDADTFPAKYKNGVFVGQHGSWNRSTLSGYRVVFIPFENGKPAAQPEDFLTGFIANENKSEVYGRPVCVAVTPEGDLLVNDDAGNVIWKVSYSK